MRLRGYSLSICELLAERLSFKGLTKTAYKYVQPEFQRRAGDWAIANTSRYKIRLATSHITKSCVGCMKNEVIFVLLKEVVVISKNIALAQPVLG